MPLAETDRRVAERLRKRRRELDMTQAKLGSAVGLTAAQVHKYERGLTMIPVGRLAEIAAALDKPPEYFFSD